MARTTLAIDDDLLRRLKERAAAEHRPMHAVANDLLRQALARGQRRARHRLVLTGWRAELGRGVDLLDRDQLHDLMDARTP